MTLIAACGLLVHNTQTLTGHFAYPLDDTYIHLGLARVFVQTGTWGINPGEVTSATSSPLWTLILAAGLTLTEHGGRLAGALNLLAGIGLLLYTDRTWREQQLSPITRTIGHIAIVALAPLCFVVGLGMEHTLHALATIVFAHQLHKHTPHNTICLALAFCLPLIRYEALFLVAWAGLSAIANRRIKTGLLIWTLGAAGISAYGLWNMTQGGFFLPNSILMKSAIAGGWKQHLSENLVQGAAIWSLLLAICATARTDKHTAPVLLFAATTITHLLAARVGWLFRYEAYLLIWGGTLAVMVFAQTLQRARSHSAGALMTATIALGIGLVVWSARASEAITQYARYAHRTAVYNLWIADQIQQHWANDVVAIHDIGGFRWRTDVRIFDLAGLANNDIVQRHRAHTLSPNAFDELAQQAGARIAIVSHEWLNGDPPARWKQIGQFSPISPADRATIPDVHLYAITPQAADRLHETLLAAVSTLPPALTLSLDSPTRLPLDQLSRSGAAVIQETNQLAFYTNGAACLPSPRTGTAVAWVAGNRADDRMPRFSLTAADRTTNAEVRPSGRGIVSAPISAGEALCIRYQDDLIDEDGRDRNLWLLGVAVYPR